MQINSTSSAYSSTSLTQMHSKLFSSIDADADGALTLEELQSSDKGDKAGKSGSSTSVADRFASMDTDGDGSVTQEEGLAFFTRSMSSDTMGRMLQAQEDATAGGPPPGPAPSEGGQGGQAPQSFDELDTNEDGTVSLDEMLASSGSEETGDASKIEDLFAMMDSDGDGSVTQEEKTAFDDQMKADGPPPQASAGADGTTDVSEDTAAKIASLTAQWAQSIYQALSEDAKATSTTSVAA